jgi:hypothetical protein
METAPTVLIHVGVAACSAQLSGCDVFWLQNNVNKGFLSSLFLPLSIHLLPFHLLL